MPVHATLDETGKVPAAQLPEITITKEGIEAVLTGEITSHTHPGGGGGLSSPQVLARSLGA